MSGQFTSDWVASSKRISASPTLMPNRRFHILRTSSSKNLLLADSQTKHIDFPNFNILSIPGARIAHAQQFIPRKDKYDIIVIFLGGNDLYDGEYPSSLTGQEVVDELDQLGEQLCKLAKKVYILGIPHRGIYRERSSKTNKLLESKNKSIRSWKYRGVSEEIFSEVHIGNDNVHLSPSGISGVKTILKKRVLYNKYSNKCDKEGHLRYFECPFQTCNCSF